MKARWNVPRGIVLHALFLLLAASYAGHVWRERATPRGDAPVLLDAGIDALESVEYRWPDGTTRVTRDGEGKGRTYAVTVTRRYDPQAEARAAAAMADPKNRMAIKTGADPAAIEAAARAAAPAGPLATETATFPPGLFPIATIQKLTPLRARRSLGDIADAERGGMGLAGAARGLRVAAGGTTLVLELGNETYGGQAYYARRPGSDEVFLLDAEIVRTFETTPRAMMDSRIVTVVLSDVVGLRIETGGRVAEYVHRNKDQFRARYFARKDGPDVRSEAVDGLTSTFVGLKTVAFSQEPPAGEPLATVRFLRDAAPPYEVALYRAASGEGYSVRAGRWTAPVTETEGRKILEEIRAAAG